MTSLIKEEAEKLWDGLKHSLLRADELIREIIDTQAWKPLGFRSFTEAWRSKLEGVTLATEARPHVVYQMLSEGCTPDEIAFSVKGIGAQRAESLARQRANGVPPELASMTVVNTHYRTKPSQPDTIHVTVGAAMLTDYRRISKVIGRPVESIAKEAIEQRFRELNKMTLGKSQ